MVDEAVVDEAVVDGEARGTVQQGPRVPNVPNRVLRGIRTGERGESQREFADAMARVAWEMGAEVYPDEGYVHRLESGIISWPHRTYRTILEKLCGRPVRELGFSPSARSGSRTASSRVNVEFRDAVWGSGMEISRLARMVGVAPKTAERWITLGRTPRPLHRWKASLILGVDESELWPGATVSGEPEKQPRARSASAASDAARDSRETNYDLNEEVMKRRSFLIGTAAVAGLGKVDTPAAIETIRQELNISLAEERGGYDSDEWNQIVLDYGEAYSSAAPTDLIEPLMVDMLGIQVALRRNERNSTQPDLLRAAALLSAFTAQTLINMGHPLEARRWWRTAKSAADRSGDPYSVLWVRGREILRAMEIRPIPVILGLIEEAEGMTRNAPPDATVELIAAKAEVLAIAGRKRDATETLGKLRNESEKSPGAFSGSVLFWGQERLLGTESFTYSRLGDRPKAEIATADGIRLRAANGNPSIRHQAVLQVNIAFSLVGSGDVSGGLDQARAVISGLPEMQRDARLVSDGRKLLDIIPMSDQRSAVVKEYSEWISSICGLTAHDNGSPPAT